MRSFSRIAVAATLLVLLSGCVPTDAQSGSRRDDTVIVVLGMPPSTLIPYSANTSARQVGSLVYQALVSLDASGRPQPDLARVVPTYANEGVSADGKTVTFELDPEARWHDGERVTASDVVFTCDLLRGGRLYADAPATWRRLGKVEAVDDTTVRMEFSEPDIPGALMMVPFVLPAHLLADSEDLVSDSYWSEPVGSGAFRVDSAVRRRSVLLSRVQGEGVKKVRCVFHEDVGAMVEAWDDADRAVWPGAVVDRLGAEKLAVAPSATRRYYLFNTAKDHVTADITVRRVAAALIVAEAGEVTATAFGAGAVDGLSAQEAVAELEAAGWKVGVNNVRRSAGDELRLDFPYRPESEADGYHMDSVAAALKRAGFGVRTQARMFYGDYYSPGASLIQSQWDVARIVAPEGAPAGFAWPFEAGDEPTFENPGGLNLGHTEDDQLDSLLRQMRASDDSDRRNEIKVEFGRRLRELAVIVPDQVRESRTLYRGLSGVEAFTFEADAIRGAADWHLAESTDQQND